MKSLYLLLGGLLLPFFSLAQINNYTLTGCAKFWANDQPVKNVRLQVILDYTGQSDETFYGGASPDSLCSLVDLTADLAAPNNGFYFAASKTDDQNDFRNGLSVADLSCIYRHILGLEPLPFYARLAADANNSRSITTFDIVEFRKLLLGIYDTLPNASNWIVWPPHCGEFDPANPFQQYCFNLPFDTLNALQDSTLNVVAVKCGDVDGDYAVDGNYAPQFSLSAASIYLPDNFQSTGSSIKLPIYPEAGFSGEGIQFALKYDTSALLLTEIIPGPGNDLDSWGVFSVEGIIRNVSLFPFPSTVDTIGWLRFDVKKSGFTSEFIAPDSTLLPAMYTQGCSNNGPLEFFFDKSTNSISPEKNVLVAAPAPNPFSEQSIIRVMLERSEKLQLEIFSPSGKKLYTNVRELSPGTHQMVIPAQAIPGGGMGIYRLHIGDGVFTGKIFRLD